MTMIKKRAFGILISLMMVLTMMPMLTLKAYATDYNLWVDGNQVTDGNLSGNGWSYEAGTNTLTLNGYTHNGGNTYQNAAIYADSDLNIVLEGKNTINCSDTYGIRVDDKPLTITGPDELNVTGTQAGIMTKYGNVTINSGSITANGGVGILADGGDIQIKNGIVNATGNDTYGIRTDFITIDNGTVTANGKKNGISAANKVTINGGKVDATGKEGRGLSASDDVKIFDGNITATGAAGGISAGTFKVTISGGTVTATATGNNGNGIFATGSVTISQNSNVTATATGEDGNGIYTENGEITISGGTVNASVTSDTTQGNSGIYSNLGDIKISGGTVNATGCKKAGIYSSSRQINISNAAVTADGASGIEGGGGVTINSGTVNASGGNGIASGGNVTIIDGSVIATGNDGEDAVGIFSSKGNIEISGGTVSATATGKNGTGIRSIYESLFLHTGGKITISGGAVTATATGNNGIGIKADIDITIQNDKVTAVGGKQALSCGTLINEIPGTGWRNVDGSGDEAYIDINTAVDLNGYKKVQFPPAPATVITAPAAKSLTYNGSAQELVTAGTAKGGTMQYAIGTDATTVPTSGWSASIPTGTEVGTYYVWYKAVGDAYHTDSEPQGPLTVTIAKRTYTITYDLNGGKLDGKTGTVTIKADEGSVITLPKPTRKGYKFDYWKGSKYKAGDKYTVSGDHTFKAVWKSAGDSSSKGADTGDDNSIIPWLSLMIMATGGLAIMLRKSAKEKK